MLRIKVFNTTRGHAPFAEVAIKTSKLNVQKRIETEQEGKKRIHWTDYILETPLTYDNPMKHLTTELTSNEARRPQNEFEVKMNISTKTVKKGCSLI